MERIFYIDHIKTDDINKLTLRLNEMQEVSHIKISKDSISFNCARPDNVQAFLKESDLDYVLKEMVNKRKREYVSSKAKTTQFFMFENLNSEEEANDIKDVLSKYSAYENVEIDFQNKILTLTTNTDRTLNRLNLIIENVNPDIHVEQWKKPFKSQDIFKDQYMKKYLRIALLLVGTALALVTRSEVNVLTYAGWFVALAIICEPIIERVKRSFMLKQYINEDFIILVACFIGWAYQVFYEAIIVAILYQLGLALVTKVSNDTVEKIDDLVNSEEKVRRLKRGKEEMVLLTDCNIGDILVINKGEVIPLGGKIVKGQATLDIYAVDGSDVFVESEIGQDVLGGTVVTEGSVQVKTSVLYEDSAMNAVLNIAMNAPTTQSPTEKVIASISKWYTLALFVIGVLMCTAVVFMNPVDNGQAYYLGLIMLTMAGSSVYKIGASYSIIAGIAKAFSKKITIKENTGLDDVNACATIIYDRFNGVETTDEEFDLFNKLLKLHKDLIIFNDGPVDLGQEQYKIYNNLTVEEKMVVMDEAMIAGKVAYIGDCDKDVALLQKASIGISRGGIHDEVVIKNSDIMLADSNFDTIVDLFTISRKQKAVNIQNTFIGILVSLLVVLLAVIQVIPWHVAMIVYYIETLLVLMNAQRITKL